MREELTRLQASRKAFKGHVTRLHNKIDELMAKNFDGYTIASLTATIEQIKKKGERITQMDEKIATLISNASELETAVFDAEEIQDEIVDKVTRAGRFIELKTMKQPERVPTPPVNRSDLLQPGGANQPMLNVTVSGKTGLIAHLKVSRNVGFKYSVCCSWPMVVATHTKFSHVSQQFLTLLIIH